MTFGRTQQTPEQQIEQLQQHKSLLSRCRPDCSIPGSTGQKMCVSTSQAEIPDQSSIVVTSIYTIHYTRHPITAVSANQGAVVADLKQPNKLTCVAERGNSTR